MTDYDKTVEAVAKALHADACTQDDECSHFINEWTREARIAIEAHEAAKGEGGIPLVDHEAFREAFFETWTNATPVGAVATFEQAWGMVEAVLDNADLTPDPLTEGETEREALEFLTGLYVCTRDESAWAHGTMTLDDFHRADQDEDVLADLSALVAQALSQRPTPALAESDSPSATVSAETTLGELAEIFRAWKTQGITDAAIQYAIDRVKEVTK